MMENKSARLVDLFAGWEKKKNTGNLGLLGLFLLIIIYLSQNDDKLLHSWRNSSNKRKQESAVKNVFTAEVEYKKKPTIPKQAKELKEKEEEEEETRKEDEEKNKNWDVRKEKVGGNWNKSATFQNRKWRRATLLRRSLSKMLGSTIPLRYPVFDEKEDETEVEDTVTDADGRLASTLCEAFDDIEESWGCWYLEAIRIGEILSTTDESMHNSVIHHAEDFEKPYLIPIVAENLLIRRNIFVIEDALFHQIVGDDSTRNSVVYLGDLVLLYATYLACIDHKTLKEWNVI